MADTSGPAFPVTDPLVEVISEGLSQRLYLMAHAPAPPESWVAGQRDRHKTQEGIERAQHKRMMQSIERRGDPLPEPRQPIPRPTDLDLDIRWRLAWADRALELNSEE